MIALSLNIKLGMMGKDIHKHRKEGSVSGLVHTHFLHPLPHPLLLFTQVPTLKPSTQALVITEPLHLGIVDSRNPLVALQTCSSITPTVSSTPGLAPLKLLLSLPRGSLSLAAHPAHLISTLNPLRCSRQFSFILARAHCPHLWLSVFTFNYIYIHFAGRRPEGPSAPALDPILVQSGLLPH